MASSPDAVAYIYENVGVGVVPSSSEGVSYIYENVGIAGVKVSDGVAYIYEFVDNTNPRQPHLWMITPPVGGEGTYIEIWGQGWTGDDIKFFLGAQVGWDGEEEILASFEMQQIVPAALVAASGDAYGVSRSIPAANDPNVEYWKATIQVPEDPLSGVRKIRVQVTDNP